MKLAMAASLHWRCPMGLAVVIVTHQQHFSSGGAKFQGLMRQSTLLTSLLDPGVLPTITEPSSAVINCASPLFAKPITHAKTHNLVS